MGKQTLEVDVPEGWEAVEFRRPLAGEYYLDGCSAVQAKIDFFFRQHLVLKPIAGPKAEPATETVVSIETLVCLVAGLGERIAALEKINFERDINESGPNEY